MLIVINSKKGIRLILNIYKVILFIIILQELYAANLLVPQQYNTIQDAVNNAVKGDTILISSGFYKENIIINKVLTIKSASTSSTVIIEDATSTPPTGYIGSYIFLVQAYGSGEISGLILQGNNNRDVYCTGMKFTQDGWLVKDCTFQNLGGIYTYESSTIIKNNIFRKLKGMAVSAGKSTRVIGNVIHGDKETGVIAADKVYISNNLFEDCMFAINGGGENDSIYIRNNTFSSIGNIFASNQIGINLNDNASPKRIENNIIAFNNGFGLMSSYTNSSVPDAYVLNNNNVFMNLDNYFNMENLTGSNGNISQDPIFCDNDSLFFLASDSPCINAGVVEILDIDGSQSDMGMYGGTDAIEIKYGPSSFNIIQPEDKVIIHINNDPFSEDDSVVIKFRWSESFDRDQISPPKYRIIIGTKIRTNICRNINCNTYFVQDIVDTLFTDSTFLLVNLSKYRRNEYYYVVEAYDNDGLFKRTNTVQSFILVDDNIIPDDYFVLQNFPNPFNANTKIRYGLPFSGIISIKLYDILGGEVLTIDEGFKTSGFYEATLNSSELSSGVYIYQFNLISPNLQDGVKLNTNIPIIKKLILIK